MSDAPSATHPLVYIVIVNFNGHDDTIECLESLKYLRDANYRIIVCDNASAAESVDHISRWQEGVVAVDRRAGPWRTMPEQALANPAMTVVEPAEAATFVPMTDLTLVRLGENLGFAGANNIGMKAALRDPNCRYVWLLNNDTVAEPESLAALVGEMVDRPELGICGSTLLLYRQPDRCQGVGVSYNLLLSRGTELAANASPDRLPLQSEVEPQIDYVIGASMLVSRTFLETVGLMSEDYFLYYEEIDWATRAKGKFAQGWSPGSIVYHKYGSTIEAGGLRYTNIYYLNIGLLRFMKRFHPLLLPLSVIRIALLAGRAVLRRQSGVVKVLGMVAGDFVSGRRRRGKIEPKGA